MTTEQVIKDLNACLRFDDYSCLMEDIDSLVEEMMEEKGNA